MRPSIKVGDRFLSKRGYYGTVVEYIDYNNIVVQFDTGNFQTHIAGNLRKGEFKDWMYPEVCGVGYFGKGEHKGSFKGKDTFEYSKWLHMLDRCYGSLRDTYAPSYEGVTVSEEWHNFQTFAGWVKMQRGYGKRGWHLDKDILNPGAKHYSPENCLLVPAYINTFFTKPTRENDLPLGVTKVSGYDHYKVAINFLGKRRHVGTFICKEEASRAFMEFKNKFTYDLAQIYKDEIDPKLYQKLIQYSEEGFPYEKF